MTSFRQASLSYSMPVCISSSAVIPPLRRLCTRLPTPERTGPTVSLYQLERFRVQAPPETFDTEVFDHVRWVGGPELALDKDLANLRDPMAKLARAAAFVGAKTTGFMGDKPGIRDEFERFRAYHAEGPVYLVGGARGEAARLIDAATGAN